MISTKKILMNTLAVLTLGSVVLLGFAAGAEAKLLDDHLTCFKIKDAGKIRVKVDMIANELQSEFSIHGCKVKAKADKFCVPSTKVVTYGEHDPIGGQKLENDFLCYKIRCEKQDLDPRRLVIDQFGRRHVGAFKPMEICTPAWKLDIQPGDINPIDPSDLD